MTSARWTVRRFTAECPGCGDEVRLVVEGLSTFICANCVRAAAKALERHERRKANTAYARALRGPQLPAGEFMPEEARASVALDGQTQSFPPCKRHKWTRRGTCSECGAVKRPARRKAKTTRESSLVAWGAHLARRKGARR